jgi:hypothetical protein
MPPTQEPQRPLVVSFWIWIALTALVIAAGPVLSHHRGSRGESAMLDVTAK